MPEDSVVTKAVTEVLKKAKPDDRHDPFFAALFQCGSAADVAWIKEYQSRLPLANLKVRSGLPGRVGLLIRRLSEDGNDNKQDGTE
jgi:hypothetical protein